jgi:hypothetical protein
MGSTCSSAIAARDPVWLSDHTFAVFPPVALQHGLDLVYEATDLHRDANAGWVGPGHRPARLDDPRKARTCAGFAAKRLQRSELWLLLEAARLKSSCTGPRFGSFAAVPPRTEWAVEEMRTLRSELDERLDDLVEAVGQTLGQRIDLLEEEVGGLREELRSEIGGVWRAIRLLSIAVILALVGVLTTLLLELL